jgi:hypothetical protein
MVKLTIYFSMVLELLSIYLFLVFIVNDKVIFKVLFLCISIFTGIIAWLIYEGSFFMEPIRLGLALLLFYSVSSSCKLFGERLFSSYAIYVLVDILFIIWRLFLSSSQRSVNDHVLANGNIIDFNMLRILWDFIDGISFVWVLPLLLISGSNNGQFTWIAVIISAVVSIGWLFLLRWQNGNDENPLQPGRQLYGGEKIDKGLLCTAVLISSVALGLVASKISTGHLAISRPLPQLIVLCVVLIYVIFTLVPQKDAIKLSAIFSWPYCWITLGLLTALFGLLAMGILGYHPVINDYRDRYFLPSIYGFSILIVGCIALVRSKYLQYILITALIFLGASFHLHNANIHRKAWEYQLSFAKQLSIRAPSIKPGSVVILRSKGIPYPAADYNMMGLLSLVYQFKSLDEGVGGTFLGRWKDNDIIDNIKKGATISIGARNATVKGDFGKSLLLVFDDCEACLHVIDGKMPYWPWGTHGLEISLSEHSNINIINQEDKRVAMPGFIAKYKLENDWCTYYQKAELSLHDGEWDQVIKQYLDADKAGLRPKDPSEWLPLVKALVMTGKTAQARKVADRIYKQYPAGVIASEILEKK